MASKAIAILYVTLVYLSFTIIATYGDQVAVKESKDDCPSNCKCENDQVRCSHFILNQDLQLPEKTKLLIFENAVSCEDEHLHNLLPLALSKQIKISGQCSKPKRLIGSSLAELIAEKLSSTNHLRDKRSNFATPSIYNFTETPQATAGCTFDEGMCGWVQLSNVDFFDWTRHSGSTPSSYTGPRYDHTSNSTEGFYIYTETSRPRVLGEYADLMSPPMLAATSSSTVEIKFYYHAYGSSLGKLQLYAMYPSVSQAFYSITNVSLYSVNQWRPFSTTFQPLYNPYRIIIRGTVGQSYTGDNAIDDIFISSVENNCYVPFSEVYRGINSQTTSGSYCRSWASSTAQYYNHTPSNYPYSDLGFSYCRNPGGERSRPWCYVSTGSTWDYCNIPRCIAPTTTRAQYPLGRRYPVALINFDHGQHYIGRVAIYHDGEWGTIYGGSLSHSFIGLLCKQAGLGNYGSRYYGAGYGIAGVGKVWLDYTRIACPASSNSINNCTLGSWGSTYGHSSDLWLTCSWHSTYTTANPAVSTSISTANFLSLYKLSLQDGRNSTTGWVQVDYNTRSGAICSSSWNLNSADVVCRQLGYIGAYSFNSLSGSNPPSAVTTVISYIYCRGYEPSIDACTLRTTPSICYSSSIRQVSCNPGRSIYFSYNKPEYCTFQYGLCGWKATGKKTWIWYPRNSGHFSPFGGQSYSSFIYAYQAARSTAVVATLVSPRIYRAFRTQYVRFQYYVMGYNFDSLVLSYSPSASVSYTIYSTYRLSSGVKGVWIGKSSNSFYPNGNYILRLVCKTYSGSPSSSSGVGFRNIILFYGYSSPVSTYPPTNGYNPHVNVTSIIIGVTVTIILIIFAIIIFTYRHRYINSRGRPFNSPSSGMPVPGTRITNPPPNTSSNTSTAPPPAYGVAVTSQTPGISYPAVYGAPPPGHGVAQPGYGFGQTPYVVSYNVNAGTPQTSPPLYETVSQSQNTTHAAEMQNNELSKINT